LRVKFLLCFFTMLGFLVMGYHPGIEDDGVYLSAVKSDLNPALYPHNADFFRLEMKATHFDTWMADFVRVTHIPLATSALLWQVAAIFAILFATWSIARQLFSDEAAQWGAVAMVSAMLTLPVSGTAIYILDQHLHPRSLATALLLLAVSSLLARKRWQAVPLVLLAIAFHPIMGVLGAFFCVALEITLMQPASAAIPEPELAETAATFGVIPFGWLLAKPSGIWLDALRSRHWFRLYSWTWYEWLGALGPLAIFWCIARLGKNRPDNTLSRFAAATVGYGTLFLVLSLIVLSPRLPSGVGTLEPMRFLHLIYIFLAMMIGALLGKRVLRNRLWRWALFLIVVNGGMFAAQRQLFASTEHLELPGRSTSNSWLQAFAWIRANTPVDAYFALDPKYMADPGEDYHSFRALAERSALSDAIKDASVVTKVPDLGPVWEAQQAAQQGWNHFRLADFERLHSEFGVNWVLVSNPAPIGLDCPWHNDALTVCRIP